MSQSIYEIQETGSINGLVLKKNQIIPEPGQNEALIKQTFLGINYADYQYVFGKLKATKLPFIPGCEGVGTVVKFGDDVNDLRIGQRVGYCTVNGGGFCEYRTVDHEYLFPIPDEISDQDAVSYMKKGMTAHYLLRRTFFVKEGMHILLYAASSSVGQIMMNLIKHYNAKTVALVANQKSKSLIVEKSNPLAVFTYDEIDLREKVLEVTGGRMINVAYDFLGGDIVSRSVDLMNQFGLIAGCGNILNEPPNINLSLLLKKGLFVTAPRIATYKNSVTELVLSAYEVCGMIKNGILPSGVGYVYDFDRIPEAINSIDSRTNHRPSIVKI